MCLYASLCFRLYGSFSLSIYCTCMCLFLYLWVCASLLQSISLSPPVSLPASPHPFSHPPTDDSRGREGGGRLPHHFPQQNGNLTHLAGQVNDTGLLFLGKVSVIGEYNWSAPQVSSGIRRELLTDLVRCSSQLRASHTPHIIRRSREDQ